MSNVYGRGLSGLLKRSWHEIPDIVGSSIMAVIGTGLGIYGLAYYYANDLDNRRYRENYTVIRHDDPRAEKVRRD